MEQVFREWILVIEKLNIDEYIKELLKTLKGNKWSTKDRHTCLRIGYKNEL